MDLTSVQVLKDLLYRRNIRPNKRLGQNFLVDKNALQKLVEAVNISKNDTVVEVGAGIGTITVELAKFAKRVIAVEKDKKLLPILEEVAGEFNNIEVINYDILKIDELKIDWKLEIGNWKLVGNIPYYLTAPLIRKFLELKNPPKQMVLMAQKEMAERICAKPPSMSILAVSVQVYARPEIIDYVPRSSFWPKPNVDSAILRITQINTDLKTDVRRFFAIVRAGFANPRKQIGNNVPKKLLQAAGIDPTRRAETLTIEEWITLWYNT